MTFYISPFWCGVIATVVFEFGVIVGTAVISASRKDKKKGENDVKEEDGDFTVAYDDRDQRNDSTGENH